MNKTIDEIKMRETVVCATCRKTPETKQEEDNIKRGMSCMSCDKDYSKLREAV